ncbi:TetR family transcriptional regulator [Cellulomonas chitinilytica]|uniref:TetR family transcriptional regulator n=1 Tax=Cellulomonas chitinilytica TaxID=398759 RepID=A0A919P7U4_9CELL|nr:TetR/AcrR family transcriptional regulator [Cellulomonas chitinilytica]GIG22864.1 TetR family transcriptional regulator [Cellulomonas chitinilytica]
MPSTEVPSVPATARERARAQVLAELLDAARTRLETDGAADLSLRAVARDLGVASSAVYRYVESRDALLTLLIIETYDAVGTVAETAAADARARGADPARTWLEVARAVRTWALAQPYAFELIYGTPVRGYRAPDDTVPSALRMWGVIVGVLQQADAEGTLSPAGPDFDPRGRVTPEVVAAVGGALGPVPDDALRTAARSATLFCSLLGAVSAELFGHLHRFADDYAALFDVTIATAAAGVGLHADLTAP